MRFGFIKFENAVSTLKAGGAIYSRQSQKITWMDLYGPLGGVVGTLHPSTFNKLLKDKIIYPPGHPHKYELIQ